MDPVAAPADMRSRLVRAWQHKQKALRHVLTTSRVVFAVRLVSVLLGTGMLLTVRTPVPRPAARWCVCVRVPGPGHSPAQRAYDGRSGVNST